MGDSLGALVAPFNKSGDKMKRAVNFLDRNQIKRMSAEGKAAKYIAQALKIDEAVVKAFMPAKPKKEEKTDAS